MDMIDVIKIAREFAEIAGWGFFRAHNITYDSQKKEWELTVYVGAFSDNLIKFIIDDVTKKVIGYGPKKPEE